MKPELAIVVDTEVIDIPTKWPAGERDERIDNRRKWAERIGGALGKSVEAIVEAGALLTEAKADLDHGDFLEMLRGDLHLGHRMAQKLMAIAAHPLISNASISTHLPASWTTLYELTRWKEPELKLALGGHRGINGSTKGVDLKDIRARARYTLRGYTTDPVKPAKTTPQPVSFFKAGQRLFSPAQIKAMNSLDDGLKAELWMKFAEKIYPLLEEPAHE